MGNSPDKVQPINNTIHHVHWTQSDVAQSSECFEDADNRVRIRGTGEPPPSYEVSCNQRNYCPSAPCAPQSPVDNRGFHNLYPNLHESRMQNSYPVTASVPEKIKITRSEGNELQEELIDIHYLLHLCTKEKAHVVGQMILHKNSFMKLLKDPLENSLMLILMKLIKKVCLSDILDEKINILKFVCCKNLFHCLGDYISNLPTHEQDSAQEDRLFLVETVVPFLESVFLLIPQERPELRDLVIKTSLSVQGMEQYRGIEISDDTKQCVQKMVFELQDNVKIDPKLKSSDNKEILKMNSRCSNDSVENVLQYSSESKRKQSSTEKSIKKNTQLEGESRKDQVNNHELVKNRTSQTGTGGKLTKDAQPENVSYGVSNPRVLKKNRGPQNDTVKNTFRTENEIQSLSTGGKFTEDSQPENVSYGGKVNNPRVLKKNRGPQNDTVKNTFRTENEIQALSTGGKFTEDTQPENVSYGGNKNSQPAQCDELIPSVQEMSYQVVSKILNTFKTKKVRGMQKNFFFIDNANKKENNGEFLFALAQYLTKQQYEASNILLLCTDNDDLQSTLRIRKKYKALENITLKLLSDTESWSCSIILMMFSLKSSLGTLKFILDIFHKASLEAREGFFIIGDMVYLEKLTPFWSVVNAYLQVNESISPSLSLCCQTHSAVSVVNKVQDFNVHRNGGCDKDCNVKLDCGHNCVRRCHTDDTEHKEYFCHKPCTRKPEYCTRNHSCKKFCFEVCGPCPHTVYLFGQSIICHTIPQTNATQVVDQNSNNEDTQNTKSDVFEVDNLSHNPKTNISRKNIGLLPCGHSATNLLPFRKVDHWSSELVNLCQEPCSTSLECGHTCTGTCGKCRQGRIHISCQNSRKIKLACGHRVFVECKVNIANCYQKCYYQCSHSLCQNKCGEVCTPCNKPCVRGCIHGRCTRRCSEKCNWQPCCKPCQKLLSCGHQCIGYCGEPCPAGPQNCRQCNAGKFKKWDKSGKARFVVLEDCNHVVRGFDLDQRMFAEYRKLEIMSCPLCGYSITKTGRYLDYNREIHRGLLLIKQQYNKYCNELPGKFWNIIEEVKQYSLPQEIEYSPQVQQLKEYTKRAASFGCIDEKSLILLQLVQNVMCSLGTAPYRPLSWILTLFLYHYENGFSNQVLKELYGLVIKQQTLNSNLNRKSLLDLHLAISYFHALEKDTWVRCPRGHVSTSGTSITLCSLCDDLHN